MRKVPHSTLYLCLAMFIATLSWQLAARAACVECDKDNTPMLGSSAAPDGSGRRLINIRIDGSLNFDNNLNSTPGQTNPNVYNAVDTSTCSGCTASGGAQLWNRARDFYNNSTGYYFKLNQSESNPDVTVKRAPPGFLPKNACAGSGPLVDSRGNDVPGKRVIYITDRIINKSPDQLAATIAHELGHLIGLHDTGGTACAGVTIMTQTAGCNPLTLDVGSQDVATSNVNLNNKNNCTQSRIGGSMNLGDGGGGGGGGGYVEPTPPYYAPPTCYYYYYARDFETCSIYDGTTTCSYAGTRYYLEDIFCF